MFKGWTSTPGTGSCTVDINECDQKAHPCSHDPPVSCVNLPGSFDCEACPPGRCFLCFCEVYNK